MAKSSINHIIAKITLEKENQKCLSTVRKGTLIYRFKQILTVYNIFKKG